MFFLNYWAPGVREFVNARTRLCDDEARAMAKSRILQLVILGAGFDTMAQRLSDTLARVRVFEIDHPTTQSIKKSCVEQMATKAKVAYLPVDFEHDDFAAKLRKAGPPDFDSSRRSLYVWMGVTYYLTRKAVESTLGQIASISPRGSRLIFDYIVEDVIAGTSADPEALSTARMMAQLGEPWIFGIVPGRVHEYLGSFGFRVIKDYDAREVRRLYSIQRPGRTMNYVRIAICEKE